MDHGKGKTQLRSLAVWALIAVLWIGLRRSQWFAALVELPVYDLITVATWPWEAEPHPDIVLLTMSDEAFWRGLDDARLADLINRLSSADASVIAVDLIRDNPLPPGTETLENAVLGSGAGSAHVLMASGLPGSGESADFKAPAFLRIADRSLDHVGLAVMPLDTPGSPMVRRGLVAINGGEMLTMSAQAVARHLAKGDDEELAQAFEVLAEISDLPADAGGYAGWENDGGDGAGNQFLLKPMRNAAKRYPVVAAETVAQMTDDEARDTFVGKIIFIGTEPNLTQDEKPVAGDPALRGVKIIAMATDQLLREAGGKEVPVRWMSNGTEDLAVALAVLLGSLSCLLPFGPFWARVLLVVPLLSVAWFSLGIWMLKDGIWFPVGAPLCATVTAGGIAWLRMLFYERRKRKSMYSLMESHLSPEVAGMIWKHNEELLLGRGTPPEMIHATAFFADLKGYSGIIDGFQRRGKNRAAIHWLDEYLKAVIPLVRADKGFVQQFVGDEIFVIFGFRAQEGGNHALQAVRCALKIAATVKSLNAEMGEGEPNYLARIGIYTGDIICGSVGDRIHRSYSFFGSTINKAARLESLRKDMHDTEKDPVRVLASDATRQAAGNGALFLPFGDGMMELDPQLPEEIVWKVT